MRQSVDQYEPQNMNEKFERTLLLEILREDIFTALSPEDIAKVEERVDLLLEGKARLLNLMDMLWKN